MNHSITVTPRPSQLTGQASSVAPWRLLAIALGASLAFAGLFAWTDADAAREGKGGGGGGREAKGGGGGGKETRNVSSKNVTRTNVNSNVNKNVNVNANVNRNVNIDVDNGRDYHPARTVAAVAVTAAVIGSVVHTLPPACSVAVVNGITYQNCGGTWYQPQYAGTQVTYVVVNAP